MRIGIDCRLAGKQHAGIGRYIEHLITQLVSSSDEIDWVFFFYSDSQAKEVLTSWYTDDRVTVVITPIKHYSLLEQIVLPFYFYKQNLDLLHIPHFNVPLIYRKKTVVTIHDLLWHEQRGAAVTTLNPLTYWLKYGFYKLITRNAIASAQTVIVPSNTIKNTLAAYYPSHKDKVVVTYEGAFSTQTSNLKPQTSNLKAQKKPYLLYVGSLYPHKNVSLVIKALTQLPEFHLYLAGSRSVFTEDIKTEVTKEHVEKQVTFLGPVTDTELSELYTNAYALVQPSLSEGFGLTGIEAIAHATPVIASDIPIFHEMYGKVALYFNPQSPQSFVDAVSKVPTLTPAELQAAAKEIKHTFSWQKMAQETLEIYKQIL